MESRLWRSKRLALTLFWTLFLGPDLGLKSVGRDITTFTKSFFFKVLNLSVKFLLLNVFPHMAHHATLTELPRKFIISL
jgi:hypothetical protein